MKRTTLSLLDELAAGLAREGRRRRVSVSQIGREALEAHLGRNGDGPRHVPFAALGGSGHHSTARDFEDVLAAAWDDDRDR